MLVETADEESERLADEAREPDQDSDEDEFKITYIVPAANKRKRSDVLNRLSTSGRFNSRSPSPENKYL